MDITSVSSSVSQPGQRVELPVATPVTQAATPVQSVNAVAPSAQIPDMEQTKDAVKTLNDAVKTMAPGLEFSIDSDIHRTIVKVVDTQTNQVIRQIPTPEAVELAKALGHLQGMLIKQQA